MTKNSLHAENASYFHYDINLYTYIAGVENDSSSLPFLKSTKFSLH